MTTFGASYQNRPGLTLDSAIIGQEAWGKGTSQVQVPPVYLSELTIEGLRISRQPVLWRQVEIAARSISRRETHDVTGVIGGEWVATGWSALAILLRPSWVRER